MRRTEALWEVFVVRFEDALERYRHRRLTADEAGELLGMSGRHFRRLTGRYEDVTRKRAGKDCATAGWARRRHGGRRRRNWRACNRAGARI
jgi:hypothetical protein